MKFTSNETKQKSTSQCQQTLKKETNVENLDLKLFNNFNHLVADWTVFDSTERPVNLY